MTARRTIADDTINTYTAFLESSQFELRHAPVEREPYWQRRIEAYKAVIAAVRSAVDAEASK